MLLLRLGREEEQSGVMNKGVAISRSLEETIDGAPVKRP